MLINIMSRFGKEAETESKVAHNERLEFLGKAIIKVNDRQALIDSKIVVKYANQYHVPVW